MEDNTGTTIEELLVDGGFTAASTCMKLQSDILRKPIRNSIISINYKPHVKIEYSKCKEATSLGAAKVASCWIQRIYTIKNYKQTAGNFDIEPDLGISHQEQLKFRYEEWKKGLSLFL